MKNKILAILMLISYTKIFAQTCQDIGMNVHFISYWSREVPFANLMMQASPWVPCDEDWKFDIKDNYLHYNKLQKDAQGYPIYIPQTLSGLSKPQIVKTILSWDNGGILPIGTYKLLYEGDGDLELFGLDSITILNKKAGQIDFNLKPSKFISNTPGERGGGLGLLIRRSNVTNPIKNIRVLLPNTDQNTYPFNPAFVDKLKPFKSIRFMNWNAAYWSDEVKWEDRRKPDYYTQFNSIDWYNIEQKGVAIEYAVQLCNILDRDIWISVPYKANENYITELGKLVLNQLNPHLKVYVEYGNEVWNEGTSGVPNDAFERQHSFVKTNAPASLSSQPFQYSYAYFSDKTFKAFNPTNSSRVIRVLAGQQGAWQGEVLQRSIEGMEYIGAKDAFDVGSVTDYMFQQDAINNLPLGATVEDVAVAFRNVLEDSYIRITENMKHLNAVGKNMVTYEGGVHATLQPGQQNEKAILEFSKDTSFYNISREWLRKVSNLSGLEMQMAFVLADDQYGYWHIENIFETDPNNSLKYKALIDHCKTVDVLELEKIDFVKYYPNPVSESLIIESTLVETVRVIIFDVHGKQYHSQVYNTSTIIIPTNNLPYGIYFFSVENSKTKINNKFVKN